MPENQIIIPRCCCHNKKNNIIKLFKSIDYCLICSTFIINTISLNKTIKPINFELTEDNSHNLLWNEKESNSTYFFISKKEYLKIRSPIIKNIKKICTNFSLSLQTYFTSIEYLDKICSSISFFDQNMIFQISLFCIILASKFLENEEKALCIQSFLKETASKNYLFDEIYVLKLLNYNLNINTSYDIIMEILYYGFIFENEDFNFNQLNVLYKIIPKILYIFSESNSYIDMSPKGVGICLMGFCRELLNLNPFSDNIKTIFMINKEDEKLYISGLNIIKKRIKIENGIKSGKIRNNIVNKKDN